MMLYLIDSNNMQRRCKRRLNISSLNAAICNVALFKNMKEREFRQQIFISYCEEGVMLEAQSVQQWQRASKYVDSFLTNKKIALLAFGYEKEVYQELIVKGLKQYTRRVKEQGEECPYINIIHYQKLRKSCEYMDKQHYRQPLKDWQRKHKKNPNFAFLIVEPIHKYEDVKRRLLEALLKKQLPFTQTFLSPLLFLLLFFNSVAKQQLKQAYQKTFIELSLERTKDKQWRDQNGDLSQHRVRIANFTALKTSDLDYRIIKSSKNLARLGLQFISSKQIETQSKKIKLFLPGSTLNNRGESISSLQVFQSMQQQLIKKYGEDYCLIPFKRSQREKYHAVISKFLNSTATKNVKQMAEQIEKNVICPYDEIDFINQINPERKDERGYGIFKACINDCPYMIHGYEQITSSELQSFLLYIEQLKTYSCTYLVRFYGVSIREGIGNNGRIPAHMTAQQKIAEYSYFLIFDYHHRTLRQMMENDMILDDFQVAQMILQILYLVNFLHTHEEPRSLGQLKVDEVYWPLRIALPYLRNCQEKIISKQQTAKGAFKSIGQGFQGDVRLAGEMMKLLLQPGSEQQSEEGEQYFRQIIESMLKQSKYQRIALPKCISTLQQLLQMG